MDSTGRRSNSIRALIGIAIAAIAVLAVSACSKSGKSNSNASQRTEDAVSDRSVGSEARLHIPGRDWVMVAVEEKSLDQLIDTLAARKSADGLVQSGKVFVMPAGTKVRIVEIGSGKVKVRVIEGDRMMQEGWVQERWIR